MSWETYKAAFPDLSYQDYIDMMQRSYEAKKEMEFEDLKKKVKGLMPEIQNAALSPQWTAAKARQNYYDPNNEFLVNTSDPDLLDVIQTINKLRTNPSPKKSKESPTPFENPFGYKAGVLRYPTWNNPNVSKNNPNVSKPPINTLSELYDNYFKSWNLDQLPKNVYIPPVPRFVPPGPPGPQNAYSPQSRVQPYSPKPETPFFANSKSNLPSQYPNPPKSQYPSLPTSQDNFKLWLSDLLRGLR